MFAGTERSAFVGEVIMNARSCSAATVSR